MGEKEGPCEEEEEGREFRGKDFQNEESWCKQVI